MLIKNVPDVKNVSVKKKNRDGPWDEAGINNFDPLLLERRYWKVEPRLIENSIRLGMKYNSPKQSFLLEIIYIHGTEVTAQNVSIRDIVGNFVESHVLQEILSISDDPCIEHGLMEKHFL